MACQSDSFGSDWLWRFLALPEPRDYAEQFMRLLDRYLLRELLVPLGYCLSGFLLLWVVQDLMNEMNNFQNANMRSGDVLEYYLVMMPEFLVLVLPMALLLALLYALTNHARHQ